MGGGIKVPDLMKLPELSLKASRCFLEHIYTWRKLIQENAGTGYRHQSSVCLSVGRESTLLESFGNGCTALSMTMRRFQKINMAKEINQPLMMRIWLKKSTCTCRALENISKLRTLCATVTHQKCSRT